MAAAGLGLALPPPARPMQAEALLLDRRQEQAQQPPPLRHGQREEVGNAAPFSAAALAPVTPENPSHRAELGVRRLISSSEGRANG